MKMLRSAAIVLAVVASMALALDGAISIGGTVSKSSCGGFKPETRTLCWRDLP
jgi:hypothetical protein